MRRYTTHEYKGDTLRSGLELAVAELLTEHGITYQYENMRIPYLVKARGGVCRECSSRNVAVKRDYTPDFFIPDTDVIIEVKGRLTAKDRKKHAAIHEQSPDNDIRLWFASNKRIFKGSPIRYTDWCEKLGIPYHVGLKEVPLSWLRKTT